MIEFSIANKINVFISTKSMNNNCKIFLEMTYKNFLLPIPEPTHVINVKISDAIPCDKNFMKLGYDARYRDGLLWLKSGHVYEKHKNMIDVNIPLKVKRGRVPFKRTTPGRHISDEIIEPLMVLLLSAEEISCYHASSIVNDKNEATVNVAWRATGKTDAILPYVFDGSVLSDDLSLIDEKARTLYAYPRPLRLYRYNIKRLNIDLINKFKLYIKSIVTPPWRPVEYISLNPRVLEANNYSKIYLNEKFSKLSLEANVDKDALFSLITEFEFAHYKQTETLLKIASII